MTKVQMLRSLVKQRLTAAAEEIFGLFERTIAEYEEELCRSKEENERQRKLLDAVFNPQPQLNEGDVQQLLVVKEEVPPEQQKWSSSVDQEDPEPPHIKKERGELWISQEGEQLQGPEEDDVIKFTFASVPVKSEDDEEKPQSSQLHQRHTEQMEIEVEVEDWGGPEPDPHLQPETCDKTGKSSEPETDDSDDWRETREYQSDLNSLKNTKVLVSDLRCNAGEKPFSCSECGKNFRLWQHLRKHIRTHSEEKRFSCSVCKKSFTRNGNLHKHMRTHTGEKPYSCSVCKKSFTESGNLYKHMRTHSGEKPYSCSVCKKSFTLRGHLQTHMMIHTGEKPFSCSVCNQRFTWLQQLRNHQCVSGQSSQPH